MIRKLVLALSILAVVAAPLSAWARDDHGPESHGRPEGRDHERFEHERFEHRDPRAWARFYTSPYIYAPVCGWRPGYWVEQPYVGAYGAYSAQPYWVPPQYVCS